MEGPDHIASLNPNELNEFVQSFKRINEFVDNELLSRDSLALREYLREITPDVDLTFIFISESTGDETTMDIPLNVEFFWPAGRG